MKLPISKLRNNSGQLKNIPANPRTISTDDYQKLIDSIKDDPEYLEHEMPHVIKHGDVYVVLNGNQRLRALKELGYKEVPVTIYPDDTPPDVIKARIIKSNHGYGKDDMDMLGNEWSDMPLDEWGIDLPDDWLEQEPEIEEDEAPEVSDEPPVSKLGEIYQLGRHRIMCADSTVKENVELLMNGEKADMVFTDPPYGMLLDTDYSGMHKSSDFGKGGKTYDKVIGDNDDFTPELITSIFDNFSYCKEIFLWGADYYRWLIPKGGSWLVWDKRGGDTGMNLDKLLGSSFELCWTLKSHKRDIARVLWSGHHGMQKSDQKSRTHPTEKPTELARWFFERWGKGTKSVADVYLGSGSTLIACEQTDRTCYGMELSEAYTDVVRKRWAKYVYPDRWEKEWEILTPAADDQLPENWEELTPAI